MAKTGSDDESQLPTVARERPKFATARGLRVSVVRGPDQGMSVSASGAPLIVGRATGIELRLTDPMISSFHLELGSEADGIRVRDLESRNGTHYHGAHVQSAVLPSGALVEIGSTSLRVELDLPLEPRATDDRESFGALRGTSRVMRELFTLLTRLAPTELSLLLEGPTGTGKELVARAIHEMGAHAGGPFVVLDCTAIPGSLAESMLFGHERGAFTGATERRPGVFEAAQDGTLLLDEVGELPVDLQPKLLRALEQRQVVRVGGSQPIDVSARIVSATWRDLRMRVNQGLFREDLYYRLAQARVALPSLREHAEDVPLLTAHFLEGLPTSSRAARAIAPEALAELAARDFPGNVRELRHVVERAAMLAAGDVILPSDLAFERMLMGECKRATDATAAADVPEPPASELPLFKEAKRTLVDEFERDYLERLVSRSGKNLSRASALAGVERHHLRDLLRKHGLWGDD